MDNYMIGVLVFLASIFISRSITNKNNMTLEVGKKAQLIDLFSRDSQVYFGGMIGLIVLYFLSLKLEWMSASTSYFAFTISAIAFLLAFTFMSYKKLHANQFPDAYIRKYILSTAIRFLGLIFFFLIILR